MLNPFPTLRYYTIHHTLLKSSLWIKRGKVDNSIKHYDALKYKFRQIGIYNAAKYLKINSCEILQLSSLSFNSDLPLMNQSTINYINLEIISIQQIDKANCSGNIIQEVCNINTNL